MSKEFKEATSKRLSNLEKQLAESSKIADKLSELQKSNEELSESHKKLQDSNEDLKRIIRILEEQMAVMDYSVELKEAETDFSKATKAIKNMGMWFAFEAIFFAGSLYIALGDTGEFKTLGVILATTTFVVFVAHFMYMLKKNALLRKTSVVRKQLNKKRLAELKNVQKSEKKQLKMSTSRMGTVLSGI